MNEDVIDDLKQFITSSLSQQTAQLKQAIKFELKQEVIDPLRQEMREGFKAVKLQITDLSESVAQALDASNTSTDEQLTNH